ncbi:MAG TPA: hypothetical protein VJN01_12215 [Xanthomonadales bacterium]|nr:hypothetical protein [Xanthomonadales bacterium]
MNPMKPTPSAVTTSITPVRMLKLRHLAGIVLFAVLMGIPTTSLLAQGTPDGQTPAEESVCDGLTGSEFGLCNAYCEATDCSDGVNYANIRACESLAKNWAKQTGSQTFPCDCDDGFVFFPGEGCGCGYDLLITITDFRPLGCPEGQGSCTYEVDIEVENQGAVDIVDPFSAMVELPGVGLGNSELFNGLGAGISEERLSIPLGPGDNCFDPDCEITAEVDGANVIEECDEQNNRDELILQG